MTSTARPARHLLEQARSLACLDPTRPRQANLRRAVSSAYYALFVLLVTEATHRFVRGRHRAWLRPVMARAFNHGEIRRTAQAVATGRLPRAFDVAASGRAITIPDELVQLSKGFLDLIQRRHLADYDPSETLSREETLDLIDAVDGLFHAWRAIRDEPATDLFLLAMLTISRVGGR